MAALYASQNLENMKGRDQVSCVVIGGEGERWSDKTVDLMDVLGRYGVPSSKSWVKVSSECALYSHDGKREGRLRRSGRRTGEKQIRLGPWVTLK